MTKSQKLRQFRKIKQEITKDGLNKCTNEELTEIHQFASFDGEQKIAQMIEEVQANRIAEKLDDSSNIDEDIKTGVFKRLHSISDMNDNDEPYTIAFIYTTGQAFLRTEIQYVGEKWQSFDE